MKVVEYQRLLFGLGSSRFIIDGCLLPIKYDSREYWCWYYNQQLYVAESMPSQRVWNRRDTVAYRLHGDFSNCYPKFPSMDFLDLLKTEKILIASSKAEISQQEWILPDGKTVCHSDSGEWYVDGFLVMKMTRPKPFLKELLAFTKITRIELFTEKEMIPTFLAIYILTGQNE